MGLGEKVKNTILETTKEAFADLIVWIEKPIVDFIKTRVALGTLQTKDVTDPLLKKRLEEMKEKWSHSPEQVDELFNDLLDIVKGRTAKVQMEELIGRNVEGDYPTMKRLFDQMGYLVDVAEFSEFLGMIGSCIPFVNTQALGQEIRSYLDYSGVTQLTGFGYGQLLNTGIGPQLQQEIRSLVQGDILNQNTIRLLYMRDWMTVDSYYEEMTKWGLNKDKAAQFYVSGLYYPGGQDFIRYAVRDVFNPEAVTSGGLMQNFPKDIVPHAAKAGMSQKILEWEWMSHWQLPTPRMGYEMLHRRFIDRAGLESLLRVSDYAPGWIDKMIAISYNPLTRVDARRFYESGVLSDAEYLNAMKDLGYDDLNAQRYVQWAKTRMADVDRDLTKAQVMTAYKLDIMTQKDTTKFLTDIGYDQSEAEFIIALEDEKERLQNIKDELEILRFEYAQGLITVEKFTKGVESLKLPITKAKKELVKAQRARTKGIKLPSKEDVLKWFESKQIDANEARDRLRRLGYQENDIKLYMGAK